MDAFAPTFGTGRGLARGQLSSVRAPVVTEAMVDQGARVLASISTMEAEFLREEARTILLTDDIDLADRQLRLLCGTPDEDYTAYAEAVLIDLHGQGLYER